MWDAPECEPKSKRPVLPAVLVGLATAFLPLQATALSEVGTGGDSRSSEQEPAEDAAPGIPLPDPLINRSTPDTTDSQEDPDDTDFETAPADAEIILDLSTLPEPVRRMRELIVEAAASGDIEQLRMLTNPGPRQTQVNGEISDPIEAMKSFSGDPEGLEILAILLDILSTGAARLDAGSPEEVYVWPYFAGKSLVTLTPPERVELLRIVTAGDLMGMEEGGNYNFYRLAITPDGEWKSFTGGD
jgi:hypothetical protein